MTEKQKYPVLSCLECTLNIYIISCGNSGYNIFLKGHRYVLYIQILETKFGNSTVLYILVFLSLNSKVPSTTIISRRYKVRQIQLRRKYLS